MHSLLKALVGKYMRVLSQNNRVAVKSLRSDHQFWGLLAHDESKCEEATPHIIDS
jgi:hypothetical protein